MMTTPQIATILDDGTYGQRDMTVEEIAAFEEMRANAEEAPADRVVP